MRHRNERRDSKSFVVVDEDCGVPTSIYERYGAFEDGGPLALPDPQSLYLSMSEYDKSQAYNVYNYTPTTRPNQGQEYSLDGTLPQAVADQYVATQVHAPAAHPPTGLPAVPAAYPSQPPDLAYYGHAYAQHGAYHAPSRRQNPEILSWTPAHGHQGTRVTVYLQSLYDFDAPSISVYLVFGRRRCQSVLQKLQSQNTMFQYAVYADAPSFDATETPSPVPVSIWLDDASFAWSSPSLDVGHFTYLDAPAYYPPDSPQAPMKKRKLSLSASPRSSPNKKAYTRIPANLSEPQTNPYLHSLNTSSVHDPQFRRPTLQDAYSPGRRFSAYDLAQSTYGAAMPSATTSQQYGHSLQVGPLHTAPTPWSFTPGLAGTTQRSSTATVASASRSSQLLPSPVAGLQPQLIRTSTLPSPVSPNSSATGQFNPYAIYPAKAVLKLDGDLNSMVEKWTPEEWDVKRRLVQFRRSQAGTVINATFEPVAPEDRIPNGICVSCIWWEEKRECYVTSVDTIQLLEALVGVRFTVEEKNRIRRNLEGFRPATVSKAKVDSEDFFKLIMGFPNPKPRNIEKDVKVFPWRILGGALKKIIGKYSASHSSTAGALPGAMSYAAGRSSEAGTEVRLGASPRSTSSSIAYPSSNLADAYSPHMGVPGGMSIGPSMMGAALPPDLRLTMPTVAGAAQATTWSNPAARYSTDLSASTSRSLIDCGGYLSSSPATGLPSSAQSLHFPAHGYPAPLTAQPGLPTEARFVSLQDYEDAGHPTTSS